MKLQTLALAIAMYSLAPSALAQQHIDTVVVGELPEDCSDVGTHKDVFIGHGNRCTSHDPGLRTYETVVIGNNNYFDSSDVITGHENRSRDNDLVVGAGNFIYGRYNDVEGRTNVVNGLGHQVTGDLNTIIGSGVEVTGSNIIAIGTAAKGSGHNCVAIGNRSECDEFDEFSVGHETEDGSPGFSRRITNMKDGRDANDAVNVGQVTTLAESLGAGAGYVNGVFTPPQYVYESGATYNNVADALYDLDGRLVNLENSPGSGDGPQGPAGQDGRSAYEVAVANGFEGDESEWLESLHGRDGVDGVGGGSDVAAGRNTEVETNEDGTKSVHLSDVVELSEEGRLAVGGTTVDAQGVRIDGGPSMTRRGIDAGNQRVTGVANGRVEHGSTDAVNGGQLWDMERRFDDRWTEVNNRLERTDERIDILGAQSAALTMMAAAGSPHGLQVGEVAFNVAPGFYGNKAALAVGYSSRLSERVSVSAGLSVASGGKAMGGVGFSFRLGR